MFDSKVDRRFRRPEFQRKLARARGFRRKAPPLETRSHAFLYYAGGFLLLLVFHFLVISKLFVVQAAAAPDGKVSSEQVGGVLRRMAGERQYLIPRSHLLFLTQKSLQAALQKSYPEVRRIVGFEKHFPNTVAITIELREGRYIWRSGDENYLLDQDGVIFERLRSTDSAVRSEPTIEDLSGQALAVSAAADARQIVSFADELRELWPRQVPQTALLGFAVPAAHSPDIFAKAELGFSVYFDLDRGAREQLRSLQYLLTREIRPETYSGLSYIDLRLPGKAYYCYKDALCAPENATSTSPIK